jgi:hypothetical protein
VAKWCKYIGLFFFWQCSHPGLILSQLQPLVQLI